MQKVKQPTYAALFGLGAGGAAVEAALGQERQARVEVLRHQPIPEFRQPQLDHGRSGCLRLSRLGLARDRGRGAVAALAVDDVLAEIRGALRECMVRQFGCNVRACVVRSVTSFNHSLIHTRIEKTKRPFFALSTLPAC